MVVLDVSSGLGPPLFWNPALPVGARLILVAAVAGVAGVVAHRSRRRARPRPRP
jgi:hypothetical protein